MQTPAEVILMIKKSEQMKKKTLKKRTSLMNYMYQIHNMVIVLQALCTAVNITQA